MKIPLSFLLLFAVTRSVPPVRHPSLTLPHQLILVNSISYVTQSRFLEESDKGVPGCAGGVDRCRLSQFSEEKVIFPVDLTFYSLAVRLQRRTYLSVCAY
jgi:hypothetical protein